MDVHEVVQNELLGKLGQMNDETLGAFREVGEAVIEEFRGAAGNPKLDASEGHALACMSSAVDEFVGRIEEMVEAGRRLMAGVGVES